MKNKNVFMMILIFLSLISISYGLTDIKSFGIDSYSDFDGGISVINDVSDIKAQNTYLLSGSFNTSVNVLNADFDGDNEKEIALIESGNLLFTDGKTLVAESTADLSEIVAVESYLEASDLNDDGTDEIYLVGKNATASNVYRIGYNGSEYLVSNIGYLGTGMLYDRVYIKCADDDNRCMLFYILAGSNTMYRYTAFDDSGIGEMYADYEDFLSYTPLEPVDIPSIIYDGGYFTLSYCTSKGTFPNAPNDYISLLSVSINSSLNFTRRFKTTTLVMSQNLYANEVGCQFTSPIEANWGGKKYVVGGRIDDGVFDSNEIGLYVFNYNTGTLFNQYDSDAPDVEGNVFSNLLSVKMFNGYSGDAVCLMGDNFDDEQLEWICTYYGSTYDYSWDYNNIWDIYTLNNTKNSKTMYAFNNMNNAQNTENILTTYGVFDFVHTSCILGDCSNPALFNLVIEDNQVVYPINSDGKETSDIFIMSPTTIKYIGDGLTDENAVIVNITTNPCISSPIKTNESVYVSIKAIDNDAIPDYINYSISAYDGDANQQQPAGLNYPSGTTATFSFKANLTGVYDLVSKAKDQAHTDYSTITNSFIVSDLGEAYGTACSQTYELPTTTTDETGNPCDTSSDCGDGYFCSNSTCQPMLTDKTSSITSAGKDIAGAFGLTTGLVVLLMLIIADLFIFWVLIAQRQFSANASIGMIVMINMLVIFLSGKAGLVSTGSVIMVFIASIIGGVIVLVNSFNK